MPVTELLPEPVKLLGKCVACRRADEAMEKRKAAWEAEMEEKVKAVEEKMAAEEAEKKAAVAAALAAGEEEDVVMGGTLAAAAAGGPAWDALVAGVGGAFGEAGGDGDVIMQNIEIGEEDDEGDARVFPFGRRYD